MANSADDAHLTGHNWSTSRIQLELGIEPDLYETISREIQTRLQSAEVLGPSMRKADAKRARDSICEAVTARFHSIIGQTDSDRQRAALLALIDHVNYKYKRSNGTAVGTGPEASPTDTPPLAPTTRLASVRVLTIMGANGSFCTLRDVVRDGVLAEQAELYDLDFEKYKAFLVEDLAFNSDTDEIVYNSGPDRVVITSERKWRAALVEMREQEKSRMDFELVRSTLEAGKEQSPMAAKVTVTPSSNLSTGESDDAMTALAIQSDSMSPDQKEIQESVAIASSAEEATHHRVELPSSPDEPQCEETTAVCEDSRPKAPSGDGRHPIPADVAPLPEGMCTDEDTSELAASMEIGLASTTVGGADMELTPTPEDASKALTSVEDQRPNSPNGLLPAVRGAMELTPPVNPPDVMASGRRLNPVTPMSCERNQCPSPLADGSPFGGPWGLRPVGSEGTRKLQDQPKPSGTADKSARPPRVPDSESTTDRTNGIIARKRKREDSTDARTRRSATLDDDDIGELVRTNDARIAEHATTAEPGPDSVDTPLSVEKQ